MLFQRDPDRSLVLLKEVLHSSYSDQRALAYKSIGVVNYFKGLFDVANSYYDSAFFAFSSLHDSLGMAAVLNNKAIIFQERGDFGNALEMQWKAYSINRLLHSDLDCVKNLTNIANIFIGQKKYKKALGVNMQAYGLIRGKYYPTLSADVLNNLGAVYSELGNLSEAIRYHKQSLSLRLKENNQLGIATSVGNLGNAYYRLDAFQKAIEYYNRAYSIFLKLDNPRGQVAQLNLLANAYRNMRNSVESELLYKKGIALAHSNGLVIQHHQLLEDYYLLLLMGARYREAESIRPLMEALADSLVNDKLNSRLADIEIKYQTKEKEQQIKLLENEKTLQRAKLQTQRQLWIVLVLVFAVVALLSSLLFVRYHMRQRWLHAELNHKNMEIENRLLRSQMNPHFIFNCMSSVSRYIGENNAAVAQSFLSKFAGLIREILNSTSHSFIPLEKELEMLHLYLQLEQKRFDDRFDFTITVDEGIDPEFVEIPPMLIQPFVENAIIHGMENIEGKGRVDIVFEKADRLIRCTVVDNGKGINDAQQAGGHPKMHKSVGIQVTKERLRMLNQKLNFEIKADVVDLRTIDASSRGTKVTVLMPYKDFE